MLNVLEAICCQYACLPAACGVVLAAHKLAPSHSPLCQPTRSYISNMSMCKFPLLATQLAAAGVSSFRFDHACAVFSKSERQGPFLMGNHADEVQDRVDAVALMRSQGCRVVCLLGHRCGAQEGRAAAVMGWERRRLIR